MNYKTCTPRQREARRGDVAMIQGTVVHYCHYEVTPRKSRFNGLVVEVLTDPSIRQLSFDHTERANRVKLPDGSTLTVATRCLFPILPPDEVVERSEQLEYQR